MSSQPMPTADAPGEPRRGGSAAGQQRAAIEFRGHRPSVSTNPADPPKVRGVTLVPGIASNAGTTVEPVSDEWDLSGFSAWLSGRAPATRKAYMSDSGRVRRVDGPQRRRRPGRRRPPAPAPLPRLARHEEAGPCHHRPQGGGAALLLLLAVPAGSHRRRPGPLPARPDRRRPPAPRAVAGRDGDAARRAGRDAARPARPRGARAALRRRAARLGALRARPRRRRPARPHRHRARQGLQAAAPADPRVGRRRRCAAGSSTGATPWPARPRPCS